MHPDGKRNSIFRIRSQKAFLLSLLNCEGFLPSVLYLSFIKMDNDEYLSALELLCSREGEVSKYEDRLLDRFHEAKVCCLVECGYWEKAYSDLEWFERRLREEPEVGLDLINFMNIAEKVKPLTDLEASVLQNIRVLLGDA